MAAFAFAGLGRQTHHLGAMFSIGCKDAVIADLVSPWWQDEWHQTRHKLHAVEYQMARPIDPYQIDSSYVDATNNGLVHTVNRFKSERIFGHVTLAKGERSELAELATNLL